MRKLKHLCIDNVLISFLNLVWNINGANKKKVIPESLQLLDKASIYEKIVL